MVLKQTNDFYAALRWSMFSGIFVIFGLLLVVIGKKRGTFSDFDLSNRTERAKFYVLLWPLLICYVIAAFLFRGIFFSLTIVSIGSIIGLVCFELVNEKVKASLHIGAATAFVITMSFLYGWGFFVGTVCIIPLLAWSRIVLKRHTLTEVFTGGLLGIMITVITLTLSKIVL
jgi:membrane-associated phospholipid phosphatase